MRESSISRRSFVRRTGTVAVGVGLLGATNGTASAQTVPPYVSTRGHFDDDATLTSGHGTFDYDTVGTVPGVDGACADDLLVFVHGWKKKGGDSEAAQAARDKFAHAKATLEADGYDGTVVGYSWDNNKGGGWDYGWGTSKDIATQNGSKLAQFLLDCKYDCGGTVRVACHSLGAEVMFSALQALDGSSYWNDRGWQVESAHVLGGAVNNERPTLEHGAGYDAVADQTRATFNYYSNDDSVLSWVYNTIEFDQALGETGTESGNTAPGNYTDYDGTAQVGTDHSGYLDSLTDEMVYHMDYVSYFD
ncbi:alpha/beta hydrolase [Halomarina oriensis]|uniref:Alpha/beta hydrolase n=1 Tax=Halomarina oriensis TaxID=671145 RepID=A0A6B0GHS1_9EURY|nr:alpha/beta hydrolase [Halomarina oriensis]MWG33341.1 alpha/beta hydrolase [Halomarina oriensis]